MQHLEDKEQAALIQWASLTAVPPHVHVGGKREKCPMVIDYLIAIPNGGARRKTEAARMKALGVKPGVSDLFLAIPRLQFGGFWIEMKRPWSTFRSPSAAAHSVSDAQREWIVRMQRTGYAACVCFGWSEAMAAIQGYLARELNISTIYGSRSI